MTIEDILLARAAQDERNWPDTEMLATGGAVLGSLAGVGVGSVPHAVSQASSNAQRLVNRVFTGNQAQPNPLSRAKPGYRMAGGLVGAILGGALGAGSRQLMIQESPAARMLAKIQVNGELSPSDEKALEDMVADTYSNQLSM